MTNLVNTSAWRNASVNRRFYKVIPDTVNSGTWVLVVNGTPVRRSNVKSTLVTEGAQRARRSGNAVLEIRRVNGQFGEYRRYFG